MNRDLFQVLIRTSVSMCLVANVAHAQVNRCVSPDGKVEYRSQPCPSNAAAREIAQPPTSRTPAPTPTAQAHQKEVIEVPYAFSSQRRKPMTEPTLPLSQATPPPGLAVGAEVIMVSGYESSADVNRVIVHRPGKQVLLVLSSYHSMNWKVEPEASTVIKGILVANSVEGKSSVVAPPSALGFEVRLKESTAAESSSFKAQIKQLNAWFGIDKVDAYRGEYSLPDKIEIYRLDVARPELTLAGIPPEAPDAKFGFDLLTADLRRVAWTNAGPAKASAQPGTNLNNGKLAISGSGKTIYRLEDDELRASTADGLAKPVPPLPANFPKFSWVMDVAYDTSQDIVAVATSGGEGFFYRYDARRNQWLTYSSLNNIDITSLVYDVQARNYLAWSTNGDLVTLSKEGKVVSTQKIAAQLSDLGSLYDKGNQRIPRLALVPHGDWVAILNLTQSSASHIWTVNLKTGQAKLTYKAPTAPLARRPAGNPIEPPKMRQAPLVKLTLLESTPPKSLAAGAEVMMVSGEKGSTAVTKVIVHRPGKQILLVLSSYDKVAWQVEPEATTVIKGIVVSTHLGKSEIVGPEATRGYTLKLPVSATLDHQFKAQMGMLNAMFGIDKLDAYSNESPLPATVEFYKVDADRPELTMAGIQSEPPQVKFSFELLDAELHATTWTNTGPSGTTTGRANLINGQVAVSGSRDTIYQLDHDELRAMGRDSKPIAVAPLPANFPKFSWAVDLAYDTHRDIVAVITHGDGGTLYRYDAKHKRWLDFHTVNNVFTNTLVYDPIAQRYLAWSRIGDLLLISKNGVFESSSKVIPLLKDFASAQSNHIGVLRERMMLAPHGDWVAIMNITGPTVSHIWSYNIKTGQAQLTYKAPSANASVGIGRLSQGAAATPRQAPPDQHSHGCVLMGTRSSCPKRD